jgi:membrane-bound lytic murein transglycosylase B
LLSLDANETSKEHWIAYHNFWVITRYNRSPLYAMSVWQLSQAIAERDRSNASAAQ